MTTGLVRWDPIRDITTMQNLMDRFFEDWKPFFEGDGWTRDRSLALDVYEDDTQYTVTTELPGVKPENINVRQEGEYLLIEAEIPEETTEHQSKRALIRERRYGRFSRRLHLPQTVDMDKVEAVFENGVLTLKLPKTAQAQPRSIQIKVAKN